MKAFIKAMDDLPLIAKIILCIPVIAEIWTVYRLLKSIDKNNIVGIVLAIVLLVVGITFMWLVDLITLILKKGQVWWLD